MVVYHKKIGDSPPFWLPLEIGDSPLFFRILPAVDEGGPGEAGAECVHHDDVALLELALLV